MRNMPSLTWLTVLLTLTPLSLTTSLWGQTRALKVVVRDMQDSVTYSTAGESGKRLNAGAVLQAGTVIQTAPGAAVDLHLGKDGGLVRLTENTTFTLDKINVTEPGASNTVEVHLQLQSGNMLAHVKTLPAGSRYHVKV